MKLSLLRSPGRGLAALAAVSLLSLALPAAGEEALPSAPAETALAGSAPDPFRSLREKAESSDINAQYEYGQRLLFGEGVEKNADKAVEFLTKASDGGQAKAALCLANHYRTGRFLLQNTTLMLKWYETAAAKGSPYAAYELGHIYQKGLFDQTADSALSDKWYSRALPLMKKQADSPAASPADAFWVGVMYSTGKGTPVNPEEAFAWWKKGALKGDQLSQYQTGYCHFHGEGAPQDYREARNWFEKAAARGDSRAAFAHALSTSKIDGPEAASRELDIIAGAGTAYHQMQAASLYRKGEVVPASKEKAFFWTRRAAENGSADAECALGVAYWKGDGIAWNPWKAYACLKRAAANGQPEAPKILSQIIQLGAAGLVILLSLTALCALLIYRSKQKKKEEGKTDAPPEKERKKH